MIESREFLFKDKKYDRRIFASDWRFSASIVGLVRYFKVMGKNFAHDDTYLYYNYNDVNNNADEDYFLFAERYFPGKMHHIEVEKLLMYSEFSEEDYKVLKDRLKANTCMKNTFKNTDVEDKDKIKDLIETKRIDLIRETFKNAKTAYAKFCNQGKIRTEKGKVCRLIGYYVDISRKTKSLGFAFEDKSRNYEDHIEFDFIPFAFTDARESIFINNNYTIDLLIRTNEQLNARIKEADYKNYRQSIFYSSYEGGGFINYDVEIIVKSQDKEYFESLFIRKESIEIFEKLVKLESFENIKKALRSRIKITDGYYLYIRDEVTNRIIDLRHLDDLIHLCLKLKEDKGFLISQLIKINREIYNKCYQKEEEMTYYGSYKDVRKSASSIKAYFKEKKIEKKIDTYRHKLIASVVANDKDGFIQTLLQLSSYTETPFAFLHDLIDNWDKNKNLAYDFINQLNYFKYQEKKEKDKGGDHNE